MRRGIKWVKLVTRLQSVLTLDFVFRGLTEELPKLVGVHLDVRGEFRGHEGTVLESAESRKLLNIVIEEKEKKNPKYFYLYLEEGKKRYKKVIVTSNQVLTSDLRVDYKKLFNLLRLYKIDFYRFTPFLHTVFAPEAILTERLKKQIAKYFKISEEKKIEVFFRILTTIPRDTDFYLEQKRLFALAKTRKDGKDIKKKLRFHARRFGYMGLTNSFLSEPHDERHFLSLIGEIQNPAAQLKDLVKVREEEKRKYYEFRSDLPDYLIDTAELLQSYMIFRNDRITALKKGQNNIKPLLQKIAGRYKVPFEDLIWYKVEEVESLIERGSKVDISNRKKNFVIEEINGRFRYSEKLSKSETKRKVREFRGDIAQPGLIKGKVRLVFSIEDVKKIKEGDILVTAMTTPDFVVAMKRAGAIVTDEGGILSHAAIVSREFGTPCLIGTRIATKVLKDGDLVEVDAEKGVVRKLN